MHPISSQLLKIEFNRQALWIRNNQDQCRCELITKDTEIKIYSPQGLVLLILKDLQHGSPPEICDPNLNQTEMVI